jgi:hypothetical protein
LRLSKCHSSNQKCQQNRFEHSILPFVFWVLGKRLCEESYSAAGVRSAKQKGRLVKLALFPISFN